MNRRLAIVLACLVATGLGLDRSGTVSEARVLLARGRSLGQLGRLASELDICAVEPDGDRTWLVINADAGQLDALRAAGLRVEVTWPDIRDQFRAQTGVDPDNTDEGRDFGFFLNYWEMQDSLVALRDAYPAICSLYSIGQSHQGRELWCLKISDSPGIEEEEPACFFNGATHAREPIGTSCVIEFACRLLSGYGNDSLETWLVDNREVYLVPVMNPDGYVYNSDSGGSSSNWRKNRHQFTGGIGVDLNRNYGYKWGFDDIGSSPNPGSELYRGPAPFSEPAVAAVRDFQLGHQFRTVLDFHSYGRLNMYPWAYSYDVPPEQELLREMADTFRTVNNYTTGQWRQVLYVSNGTSVDWELSDTAGKFVSYAFCCELSTGFWTGWNDSAHIRSECGINLPSLFYLTRVAGVYFDPVALAVEDSAQGNSSGRLDPGETADLWFTLRNRAVHRLDSAYDVSARLVSPDTLVEVLDSTASFLGVQRLSECDNRDNPFQVRASSQAQAGDTIPLRLDVTFEDAGNTITMPVAFELVVGDDSLGVSEGHGRPAARPTATIVGSTLLMLQFSASGNPPVLLDVAGRQVLDLKQGPNDVGHLSPGVYFVRLGPSATGGGPSVVHRVVIAR